MKERYSKLASVYSPLLFLTFRASLRNDFFSSSSVAVCSTSRTS